MVAKSFKLDQGAPDAFGQQFLPPHVQLQQFCQKQLNLSLNGVVAL
jgi:hypothetical protein